MSLFVNGQNRLSSASHHKSGMALIKSTSTGVKMIYVMFGFKKWCIYFSFSLFYIQILNLNIEKTLIFTFGSVW